MMALEHLDLSEFIQIGVISIERPKPSILKRWSPNINLVSDYISYKPSLAELVALQNNAIPLSTWISLF